MHRSLQPHAPEPATHAYQSLRACASQVRSSSLFEDAFLQPFAGIYRTVMMPNTSPSLDERVDELGWAVRMVYASTFSQQARQCPQGATSTPPCYNPLRQPLATPAQTPLLHPLTGASVLGEHQQSDGGGEDGRHHAGTCHTCTCTCTCTCTRTCHAGTCSCHAHAMLMPCTCHAHAMHMPMHMP